MASIFFWRKKREEEQDQSQSQSPVPSAIENEILEPQTLQDTKSPAPTMEPSKVDLVAVELPKRSSKKGIRSLFARVKFDPSNLEALEEILLEADFGLAASESIVASVRELALQRGAESEGELRAVLADVIESKLESENRNLNLNGGALPYVFLVVGVNGAGKTTTIGKLANWLVEGSWSVVLGAADTFRAAAVDQLSTWANRSGAKLVGPKSEGQDPASVAFEAVEAAISSDADIVIVDTAGRLQNKTDLMNELSKIRRVIEKRAEISEVLLVIDATTGQNGLAQAKAFSEVAKVTGVVLTKLDGTAKGGIAFAIERELGIPIKLVGVGEGIEDFAFFDPKEFASGLVA